MDVLFAPDWSDAAPYQPPPIPRDEARARLGPSPEPLCLIFGAVEPYKGQEEILAWWKTASPSAQLAIVGKPHTLECQNVIMRAAEGMPNVVLRFGWLPDEDLAIWLSAADCVIFNYKNHLHFRGRQPGSFLGSAASASVPYFHARLARAQSARPSLHKFENGFLSQLQTALATQPDYAASSSWRESISWKRVAKLTTEGYVAALGAPV